MLQSPHFPDILLPEFQMNFKDVRLIHFPIAAVFARTCPAYQIPGISSKIRGVGISTVRPSLFPAAPPRTIFKGELLG